MMSLPPVACALWTLRQNALQELFLHDSVGASMFGMSTEVETQIIQRSPDVMSGTPVFAGTRVPIQTLFDYLAGGHPLNDFLDDFPTVRREQALELLNQVKQLLANARL